VKLYTIETGKFKLDGGAMFGVVPKQMWKRINPPDDNNMCTWAMRCLLIDTGERRILVDTGLGTKQDEKFRSHFEPHGVDDLISSLKKVGFSPEDITDVFLTHLHFDHCGGAIRHNEKGEAVPTFPKAIYWSNERHYEWALNPNPRERASFLKENIVPLKDWGILKMVDVADGEEWLPGIRIKYYHGHTEAMMALQIEVNERTLLYNADLLPSAGHIGMPYVMAYDIRPLVSMEEKGRMLEEAVENNYVLYFEHDPLLECASIKRNERGRIVMDEAFSLKDVFG
jgi:glyoxylase-like metal-dependent hydrolase (beta-lactamase superfamily II)